jgi:hypothetical protein
MATTKRTIEGRDYWLTVAQACRPDPETGELFEIGQYYCTFSNREPGPRNRGQALMDDRGLARLFATSEEALEAGAREVEARLRLPAHAYAVGLPSETKEADYRAYADLLRQLGPEVDGKPPVESSFGRKWLHVWEARDQAEQFATRLRQVTRNQDWEVYDLSPPRPPSEEADKRPEPVVVLIGRQSHGVAYGLYPTSLTRIQQQFPQAHPKETVFIGTGNQAGAEASRGPIFEQVALLLTGLSREELLAAGGFRVVDPLTDLVLYDLEPPAEVVGCHAGGQGSQASR